MIDDKSANLSAKITKVSSVGLVTVEYSTDMVTDFNLTWINETVLDLYIDPANNRSNNADFNMTTVNFTWEVVSFEKNKLVIQLEFFKPAFISPEVEQDQLVIHVKDPILFIS